MRYLYEKVIIVAEAFRRELEPHCLRIEIAGGLRRKRKAVGDIELVYVPKVEKIPDPSCLPGCGEMIWVNRVDQCLRTLLHRGSLAKRMNVRGQPSWGEKNKLAVDLQSGIDIDLFATTEVCWWNYLVVRTGGGETNKRIAMAALKKDWRWNSYGPGFTSDIFDPHVATSERDVFDFVGLPWLEPEDRP